MPDSAVHPIETMIIDLENQLKIVEEKWQFLYASKIVGDIIWLYREKNDSGNKEIMASYKKKMRTINKKASAEFQQVKSTVQVSEQEMEKYISFFLESSDVDIIIKKLADSFLIKAKEVKKESSNNSPVFLQICWISSIDTKGNVVKWSTDNNEYRYKRNYQLRQWIKRNLLSIMMNRLFKENMLDKYKIEQYFAYKYIFPSCSSFNKFKVALERYFAGDFVSCLHILIPLFEEIIINVCDMLGIDIIALNQPKKWNKEVSTQDRVLGSNIILSPEFKKHRGEDIPEQIDFIMFNPLGFRLRHKVAHWEILFWECNFENCNLILFLFFTLWARLQVNIPQK